MSDQGIAFIQFLMAPFPLDRPSSEQAIKQPWVMIEDDYKSDDDKLHCVEEASAITDHDPQDEITQPDIHWTTDLDTATTRIQLESDGEGSQNMSHRVNSLYQEADPPTVIAGRKPPRRFDSPIDIRERDTPNDPAPIVIRQRNFSRRFVLDNEHHGDENHATHYQSSTSSIHFSDRSAPDPPQPPLRREGERAGKRPKRRRPSENSSLSVPMPVPDPVEKSDGAQFAGEDGIVPASERNKSKRRIISARKLSKRVLSELGYKYKRKCKMSSGNVRFLYYCDLEDAFSIMLTHTEGIRLLL